MEGDRRFDDDSYDTNGDVHNGKRKNGFNGNYSSTNGDQTFS